MNKVFVLSLFVLAFGASAVGAQKLGDPDASQEIAGRSNAILLNPMATVLSAFSGVWILEADYQHAFSDYLAASAGAAVAVGAYGQYTTAVRLGAVLHPLSGGLNGFYIGLYTAASAGMYLESINYILYQVNFWQISVASDLGYQWIFPSGFVFALGAGVEYQFVFGIRPLLVARFGFAF